MATLDDTTYNAILDRVANGELVTDVAKSFGVDRSDVWRYERQHSDTTGACLSTYTRARISQAHCMAEDTIILADSAQGMDSDGVAAVRLRVDARKWLTTKIAPRIYGDTTRHVELTGKDGGSIQVEDVSQLQVALTARLAGIASRRKLLTATARVIDAEVVEPEPDIVA